MSGELKLPASLKTIGENAFNQCYSLTSLEFAPDSQLVTIGDSAFSNCTGLSGNLTIPKSVKTINYGAFQSAYSTGTLKFEDSGALTTIDNYAFAYCGFTAVDFGKGTQELTIGESAFRECQNLKTLTLSDNIISIGNDAFRNGDWEAKISDFLSCELNLPVSLQKIGNSAFRCANITKLTFNGNNLTEIGDFAFYKTNIQGNLAIPGSVKKIGNNAFEGTHISALTFSGENLLEIGESAFKNGDWSASDPNFLSCELNLPASLQKIGKEAFRCANITKLTFNGDNLTEIGDNTFSYCKNLTGDLKIPNSVTTIGNNAFEGCSGISNIVVSQNLTTLGAGVFKNCNGYTSIVLPETLTTVGEAEIFYGCNESLKGHIYAPNSLSEEGKNSLGYYVGTISIVFYDSYDDLRIKLKDGDTFPESWK